MDFLRFLIYFGSYLAFPFLVFVSFVFMRRRDGMMRIMMGVLILMSLVFVYARFIEPKMLIVNYEKFDIGGEREESARFRIAVMSDLHVGMFKNGVDLQRIVDRINTEDVDMVMIPGDFLYHIKADEMDATFEPLSKLSMPIFAVTGNHDIGLPGNFSGEDLSAELVKVLEKNGVKVIDDEITQITLHGVSFVVLGLSDLWGGETRFSLLNEVSEDENVIVLAHNPDSVYYFPKNVAVDLVISGHTHGGQVRIPILYHYAIPTKYDFDKGFYEINGVSVFVTPGIGMVGIPLRFFMPPQLDIIEVIL